MKGKDMKPTVKPVEQVVAAIEALDLAPVKYKLMDVKEGQGWTREQADHYESEYKRFLMLHAKYSNEAIVPDKNVDKFWHAHILDTMKYAEDCDNTFGYFLHHFPYFGMRGAEDAANLAAAADNMARLYRKEFGWVEFAEPSFCDVAKSYNSAATGIGDRPCLNQDLLLAHIRPSLPAL